MNVLLLACLCLLTRSVTTTDGGPEVIKVEQDSDVILPCSLSNKQDITAAVFDWKKVAQKGQRQKEVFFYNAGVHYNNGKDGQSEQFRGRVSHFEDELKHGNASIIITNTKMADSGHYTCAFPRLQTPQTFYIELVVGAAPKPSVASLKETKDWSLLQCEAHGNPQPAVEWQDSDGNKLPADEPTFSVRGGSFYVKLNITVTKTDNYRCVVTQRTINHQIHAETSVHISGAAQEPSVTSLDETKDGMLLQCVVRGASPDLRVEWEDSDGNKLPANEPTFSERGGSHDVILQTTVTQTGRYRCVTTDQTNKRTWAEIYVSVNVSSPGWMIVAAVLGSVLFVGVLVAVFVYFKKSKLKSISCIVFNRLLISSSCVRVL
ncbi:V-set domain-containing T-cell activation inhibitor 1-like isoform X2 [Anarrhichthys ocellatus]|uniref:V-set domain-containing T-cell activation inhibitor 1-like isoform X2 n=1 Tax=Anarrhichthys ocellatus TaxID=433405 RepID=UPI0012ED83B0|nr:V-set domain-containing T-cell activation inhibitor 1-like isoform X2 [Anarrhichthys ocellatus]